MLPSTSLEATSTLEEIGEYIPVKVWIEIATRFLSERREFLSRKDIRRVQLKIMWQHEEELEEFDAALDIGFGMLKEGIIPRKNVPRCS